MKTHSYVTMWKVPQLPI